MQGSVVRARRSLAVKHFIVGRQAVTIEQGGLWRTFIHSYLGVETELIARMPFWPSSPAGTSGTEREPGVSGGAWPGGRGARQTRLQPAKVSTCPGAANQAFASALKE